MSSITCPNTSCGAVIEGTGIRHCSRCGAFLPIPAQDSDDPLIGLSILNGKYSFVRPIGEGGMGKVYLALQRVGSGSREVAIKTLLPDLAHDPQIIERFDREARTVMELKHPNTIRLYDFDKIDIQDKRVLLLVMEFLEGSSLADVLLHGPMDPARCERILAQICESLEEAHDRGFVHRDLKPENIYLTRMGARDDFVKVLDFGIAKHSKGASAQQNKVTRSGMILGTPRYMSPEQCEGKSLDPRSDVYALGLIAYEMLTGNRPFSSSTPQGWVFHHMASEPTPIEAQPNGLQVPERHRLTIMRALKKNPDDRPASVTQFFRDLSGQSEGIADRSPSSSPDGSAIQSAGAATPLPPTRVSPANTASEKPNPSPAPGSTDWPAPSLTPIQVSGSTAKTALTGNRGVRAVLAIVVVLALGSSVFLTSRKTESKPPLPTPAKSMTPDASANLVAPNVDTPDVASPDTPLLQPPPAPPSPSPSTPPPSPPNLPQSPSRSAAEIFHRGLNELQKENYIDATKALGALDTMHDVRNANQLREEIRSRGRTRIRRLQNSDCDEAQSLFRLLRRYRLAPNNTIFSDSNCPAP